jgi:hypothetical protein
VSNEVTGDEISLLRLSVEFRRDEYKELSETWRHLDTKAQGNVVISGILLASVVAFLSKGQGPATGLDRALVTVAVVSLGATIVLAVRALRVQAVTGPPHFGSIQEVIDDFLRAATTEERSARIGGLVREELALWTECNGQIRKSVDTKATRLSWAQNGILLATIIVSVFTIIRVFT